MNPQPAADPNASQPPGAHATQADETCEVAGADPQLVGAGRRGLLSDETYARLSEMFRTLSDPSRARIVHSLLRQDLCTCDLAAIVELSEPAVSQHLRVLRMMRLVKTRREGKKVFYSLDDSHVRSLLAVALDHLIHPAEDAASALEPLDGGTR